MVNGKSDRQSRLLHQSNSPSNPLKCIHPSTQSINQSINHNPPDLERDGGGGARRSALFHVRLRLAQVEALPCFGWLVCKARKDTCIGLWLGNPRSTDLRPLGRVLGGEEGVQRRGVRLRVGDVVAGVGEGQAAAVREERITRLGGEAAVHPSIDPSVRACMHECVKNKHRAHPPTQTKQANTHRIASSRTCK